MGDELLDPPETRDFHLFAGDTRDDLYQGLHGYRGPFETAERAQIEVETHRAGGVFAWNWAHIAELRDGRLCWVWRGERRGSRAMEWQAVRG